MNKEDFSLIPDTYNSFNLNKNDAGKNGLRLRHILERTAVETAAIGASGLGVSYLAGAGSIAQEVGGIIFLASIPIACGIIHTLDALDEK